MSKIWKLILCIALAAPLGAQVPEVIWTKTFGGDLDDAGTSIKQLPDSGYIVAGFLEAPAHGYYTYYLIRVDQNGDTLWTRNYGVPGFDFASSVLALNDGGFLIAGRGDSFGPGGQQIYLVRTNPFGDTVWTRFYGGEYEESAAEIKPADGGYIVVGTTSSYGQGSLDAYLVKINNAGDTIWTSTIGSSNWEDARAVELAPDGGFVIVGMQAILDNPASKILMAKIDSAGAEVWEIILDGGWSYSYANSIVAAPGGDYMAAATVCSSGECKIMVIRLDETGDTLWTKNYGQPGCNEYSSAIRRTPDGDYVILGISFCSNRRIDDIILIKIDEYGDTLWTKIISATYDHSAHSLTLNSDGGYAITGGSSDPYYYADLFIMRLTPDFVEVNGDGTIPDVFSLSQNYPNPFNAQTTIRYSLPQAGSITLSIYNIMGQKVATLLEGVQQAGAHTIIWDAKDVSSGIYFYRIKAGDYIETKRCLLLK